MHSTAAFVVGILLALGLPQLPAAGTVDQNKRVVLDMIKTINARDLDSLDELVAANVRRHSGATTGVVVESRDQFKAFLESDFAAIPDSVQTVNFILGERDKGLRLSVARSRD